MQGGWNFKTCSVIEIYCSILEILLSAINKILSIVPVGQPLNTKAMLLAIDLLISFSANCEIFSGLTGMKTVIDLGLSTTRSGSGKVFFALYVPASC